MLRRVLAGCAITLGLVAWIALALVFLNPSRLQVLDGQARIPLLIGSVAVAAVAFMAGALVSALRGSVRVASGVACGISVLLALLGLSLARMVGPLGNQWTASPNPSISVAGDVSVVRTIGGRHIDSDDCVELDVRVGHGLLLRHRAWLRCEPRPFGWIVNLSSDGRTGDITYRAERCPFHVDRDQLALVPDQGNPTCGLRVGT